MKKISLASTKCEWEYYYCYYTNSNLRQLNKFELRREREIVAQHKPTANINAKYTILFALCERKRHKGTAQKRRKIDWHKSAARTFKMPINY